MENQTSLNKLPTTRVFVAAENRSVEVLELVALFLLKTREPSVLSNGRRFPYEISCFVEIFPKREGQIHTQTQ